MGRKSKAGNTSTLSKRTRTEPNLSTGPPAKRKRTVAASQTVVIQDESDVPRDPLPKEGSNNDFPTPSLPVLPSLPVAAQENVDTASQALLIASMRNEISHLRTTINSLQRTIEEMKSSERVMQQESRTALTILNTKVDNSKLVHGLLVYFGY